jgi:serine/threonine protein kinase
MSVYTKKCPGLFEAQALRQINHPNVVRLLDADDQQVRMEMVDGITLTHYLDSNGVMSPSQTAEMAVHLLKALVATHDAGYLHRDISPNNIMLKNNRPEHPVLIDFGSACLHEDAHNKAPGTAGCRPPALFGSKTFTAPDDLFALACCLHYALTLRDVTPWTGRADHQIQAAIVDFPSEPELTNLINQCLHFEARARPTTSKLALQMLAVKKSRRWMILSALIAVVFLTSALALLHSKTAKPIQSRPLVERSQIVNIEPVQHTVHRAVSLSIQKKEEQRATKSVTGRKPRPTQTKSRKWKPKTKTAPKRATKPVEEVKPAPKKRIVYEPPRKEVTTHNGVVRYNGTLF